MFPHLYEIYSVLQTTVVSGPAAAGSAMLFLLTAAVANYLFQWNLFEYNIRMITSPCQPWVKMDETRSLKKASKGNSKNLKFKI